MVIAPGNRPGITAIVILSDGEFLPENLNHEKVLAFRQGNSTNRQLLMVKGLGVLAEASLLKPRVDPVCNYSGDGNPLHQHADKTWWFYEETWNLENGPFETYEEAYTALTVYCTELQESRNNLLTNEESCDTVEDDGTEPKPEERTPLNNRS